LGFAVENMRLIRRIKPEKVAKQAGFFQGIFNKSKPVITIPQLRDDDYFLSCPTEIGHPGSREGLILMTRCRSRMCGTP
jgi:hypothetical protein